MLGEETGTSRGPETVANDEDVRVSLSGRVHEGELDVVAGIVDRGDTITEVRIESW